MRKSLRAILSVALVAAILSIPAAGPIALAQAGTILDGRIMYTAVEIQGDALDSRIEQASSRSDFGPLLEFAQRMGFVRENATAYDITLQYQGNTGSDGKGVAAATLDMLLKTGDGKAQAHAKLYTLPGTVMPGLVTYKDKENGYQIIRIYQVQDGNVKMVQSIDTQFQPLCCAEQGNMPANGAGDVAPASTGTCLSGSIACGTVVALGCGPGLLARVAQPWICIALCLFCAGGYYYSCQQFCNDIRACP